MIRAQGTSSITAGIATADCASRKQLEMTSMRIWTRHTSRTSNVAKEEWDQPPSIYLPISIYNITVFSKADMLLEGALSKGMSHSRNIRRRKSSVVLLLYPPSKRCIRRFTMSHCVQQDCMCAGSWCVYLRYHTVVLPLQILKFDKQIAQLLEEINVG